MTLALRQSPRTAIRVVHANALSSEALGKWLRRDICRKAHHVLLDSASTSCLTCGLTRRLGGQADLIWASKLKGENGSGEVDAVDLRLGAALHRWFPNSESASARLSLLKCTGRQGRLEK
jgi:hypothetical protein